MYQRKGGALYQGISWCSRYLLQRRAYSVTTRRQQDVFYSQLEDPSTAAMLSSRVTASTPQTLTEKIVQRYSQGLAPGKRVKAGDFVTLSPHACMTHDNSWPVATKFISIGASKVHDPAQIVMTLDHDVQNKSDSNLRKYRQIEEFAKNQSVDVSNALSIISHSLRNASRLTKLKTITSTDILFY